MKQRPTEQQIIDALFAKPRAVRVMAADWINYVFLGHRWLVKVGDVFVMCMRVINIFNKVLLRTKLH